VWIGVDDDENGIQGGSYVACSLRYHFVSLSSWIDRPGAWMRGGGGRRGMKWNDEGGKSMKGYEIT
jgi:hypothetical protein